jgi:hypothetical protein
MAVVVLGASICKFCGRKLGRDEEMVGFPAFVANGYDPLIVFSDAAFHLRCFSNHPLSDAVEQRLKLHTSKTGPANRVCHICGTVIKSMGEHYALPFLSDSTVHHAVSQFNYFQAHKSCLTHRSESDALYHLLDELQSSDGWDGPVLKPLIEELRRLINS